MAAGRVWIDNKARYIHKIKPITRGKNKGKYWVWVVVPNGTKRVLVSEKAIERWPG